MGRGEIGPSRRNMAAGFSPAAQIGPFLALYGENTSGRAGAWISPVLPGFIPPGWGCWLRGAP